MTPPGAQAIRIADRAASLWERLGDSRDAPAESGGALEETARRLDRWRDVAAQGNAPAFERRLAWDRLTLPAVQAALDRAESSAPSLEWLETFGELIESIEFCRRDPPATIARDEGRPRPFEEVVRLLVQAARRRLHRVMGCPDSAALPLGLLGRRAYLALELGLLDRLCRICAASLQEQFGRARPIGLTLLNALGGSVGTTSTRHYDAFVEELLSTNLMPFFETYPALARVVTIVIGNWVEHCAEFQSRLLSDLPLIEATFQHDADRPLGTVADLRVALSDVHRHGRFVLGLTFSSGLKLAYKPKSLGIDLAFNDFIRWCNRQGVTLDLKATRILDRPGYGWMEWIDQQPCADHEDAARFYRRAGLLLGLLHVLRGTDCHNENLVAAGPHLVLVDAETLMSPDLHTPGDAIGPAAHEAFWQSVVRTGMLPCWEMCTGTSIPFDISGLGGVEPQAAPAEVAKWTDINTDGMGMSFGPLMLPRRTNAAILDGVVLSVGDHVPELVAGFAEMYGLLMRRRDALLATDGPLRGFLGQPVRYVFRPTEQYGRIQRHSLAPAHLGNGCDRSIELDHLSRGFVAEGEAATAWSLVGAEREALEELDIPRFEVRADATTVTSGDDTVGQDLFDESGYDQVVGRVQSLGEADLTRQIAIIEQSVRAWAARSDEHFDAAAGGVESASEAPRGITESERRRCFLVSANAIADTLASAAQANADGSVSWVGPAQLPGTDRCQLLPVSEGLFGGRSGIALFLAACDRVNQSNAHRALTDAALQPLRTLLRSRRPASLGHFARMVGLGLAEGLGGVVYALTSLGTWWQDAALHDEAEATARAISPKAIRSDRELDVTGGVAGAIVGLMKLYRERPSSEVLGIARECARWLLQHQLGDGEHAGAWQTPAAARPLTGFSHGASGMAYALLQVYAATREPVLLAAAWAAIEFERTAFVPDAGNWIDFRRHPPGSLPSCMVSWCHGAPGISVARLALLAERQPPLVAQDLEAALVTTRVPRAHAVDHLCCGSFGRFEILLHAARVLGRPELAEAAREQAWDILARADRFRMLPPVVPAEEAPGLFDGLAGIGYVLLRLAAPDELPSVLAWE